MHHVTTDARPIPAATWRPLNLPVTFDYDGHDATGLAALVASGAVTPDELLDEALRRVKALNPSLNAVVLLQEPGPGRIRAAVQIDD